jgi:hypothetical protein
VREESERARERRESERERDTQRERKRERERYMYARVCVCVCTWMDREIHGMPRDAALHPKPQTLNTNQCNGKKKVESSVRERALKQGEVEW